MEAVIKNALVLEVYNGSMDGDDGRPFEFHKLAVYEFTDNYPRLTLLKLPKKLIPDAQALVGKKHDLKVNIYQGKNKVDLTFEGAA